MDARPGGFEPRMVPAVDHPSAEPTDILRLEDVDAELVRLQVLPLDQQVDVFASIHQRLTEALAVTGGPGGADPRSGQGGSGPSGSSSQPHRIR